MLRRDVVSSCPPGLRLDGIQHQAKRLAEGAAARATFRA